MPGNKSRFWQELKRRKVVRVLTIYAGTAYVIVELVSNVSEPLQLPAWVPTLIIVLLAVAFPVVAIFSWIFDITPGGIRKTVDLVEVGNDHAPAAEPRRGLKVSDGIIAVLLVVICILLYPRIFGKDQLKAIRDEDGRISVAVMPFRNMTGDTLYNIWQTGIQANLISKLTRSDELAVRQPETMFDILASTGRLNLASIAPSDAGDIASKLETGTFISGDLMRAGSFIRLIAHLNDTETGEIYGSFEIDGHSENDLFRMIDSLSYLIRDYLEVEAIKQDAVYEVRAWTDTGSPEAYRLHLLGWNKFIEVDFESAIELMNRAMAIDSTFLANGFTLVYTYYSDGQYQKAKDLFYSKLYPYLDRCSEFEQLWIKYFEALFDKDPWQCISYKIATLDYDPQLRAIWHSLGLDYLQINQYDKAAEAMEKALEIDKRWGGNWNLKAIYSILGRAYHHLGNHEREREIYKMGLEKFPGYSWIIYRQAVCALSQGEPLEAKGHISKFRTQQESEGMDAYWINYYTGAIYRLGEDYVTALEIFRNLARQDPSEPNSRWQLSHILITRGIDVEEGIQFSEEGLLLVPGDCDFLYLKGKGYFIQGKVKEAYEIVRDAWEMRIIYHHEHYILLKEIEQVMKSGNQRSGS